MLIYEQLLSIFEEDTDRIYRTGEIRSELEHRFGTNRDSVIPSDYCYNRWNHGVNTQTPILVWLGKGRYRFIGPDQPYIGPILGRPRGTSADQVVGECIDGIRKMNPSYLQE